MDTKELDQILAQKYQEVYQTTHAEAEKWANDFVNSISNKQEELRSLSAKDEEIAESLRVRCKPLYEFFLKAFDQRINELKKRGMIQSQRVENINGIILVGNYPSTHKTIREVRFSGGSWIKLNLTPSNVYRGHNTGVYIHLVEQANNIEYRPGALSCSLEEIYLLQRKEPQKGGGEYYYPTGDPLLDQGFRNKLIESINHSIEFIYIEDSQQN